MAIREKKDVLKSISKVVKTVGGKAYEAYEVYFGTDHATGAKIRKVKASLADAKACVEEFYRHVKTHGPVMGILTPKETYDARDAIDLLSDAGIQMSLTDAVRRWLEAQSLTSVRDAALGAAYEEYYAGIPDVQRLHRRAVNTRVRRWVTAFGPERMCSDVTAREVSEYLSQFASVPKSYNNHMGYVRTFLGWCASDERRYLASNPLSGMKLAQIAYREPDYMLAGDVEALMRALQKRENAPRLVCYAALSFFCGIRQEEIKRLSQSPDDIQIGEEIIRISMPKGWTKGVVPRVVQIPANALEWLMTYDPRTNIHHDTSRTVEAIQSVAKEIGVDYPKNAGRHTFITMHVAAYGDPAKTEAMVGTSAKMRVSHYQGLASKKEGERYFAIVP